MLIGIQHYTYDHNGIHIPSININHWPIPHTIITTALMLLMVKSLILKPATTTTGPDITTLNIVFG